MWKGDREGRFPRRRSPRELALVTGAAAALVLLRLALTLVPFAHVVSRVERWATRRRHALSDVELERRMWAVSAAGRRVAAARPCLPQALLALAILRRAGRPAELRIGVRSEGRAAQRDGSPHAAGIAAARSRPHILAHAWVECEGRVVMGGADAPGRYVPFPRVSWSGARGARGQKSRETP